MMEILYRAAVMDDLDGVFRMVERAVKQMEREKIFQWDSIYPAREDFRNDIQEKSLYIGTIHDKIAVVYAVNEQCDEQYQNGKWQYTDENYKVIHRLCVSPDFQNKGVARMTLIHIEKELNSLGVGAIRLDVFCENPYALKLYANAGYQKTGVACWRKGKFLLMEKRICEESSLPIR